MSPFTSEESVTSTYVKNENPDIIIIAVIIVIAGLAAGYVCKSKKNGKKNASNVPMAAPAVNAILQ